MNILNKIIEDKNLVWDNSLNNQTKKFQNDLTQESINELLNEKNNLSKYTIKNFPILQKELLKLKNEFLINGCGFLIISCTSFKDFTKDEMVEIFRIISLGFGELLIQNIKNEKLVVITDEGKSMKGGGRYHQTKEGGSFHTDSPQWDRVPDFVGMFCVNPAKLGGTSKFVSAYTLHNEILKSESDFLPTLYTNFHFDKRGEFKDGESPTTFKPIFEFGDNELKFRYLRNYIDAGQKKVNSPLSTQQNHILNKLDEVIHNEDFSVSYDLKQFDMTFFNNKRVIHGRVSFDDYVKPDQKRLMIRSWIQNMS